MLLGIGDICPDMGRECSSHQGLLAQSDLGYWSSATVVPQSRHAAWQGTETWTWRGGAVLTEFEGFLLRDHLRPTGAPAMTERPRVPRRNGARHAKGAQIRGRDSESAAVERTTRFLAFPIPPLSVSKVLKCQPAPGVYSGIWWKDQWGKGRQAGVVLGGSHLTPSCGSGNFLLKKKKPENVASPPHERTWG